MGPYFNYPGFFLSIIHKIINKITYFLQIKYEFLIVAAGLQLRFDKVCTNNCFKLLSNN